jgi:hypothetical protein
VKVRPSSGFGFVLLASSSSLRHVVYKDRERSIRRHAAVARSTPAHRHRPRPAAHHPPSSCSTSPRQDSTPPSSTRSCPPLRALVSGRTTILITHVLALAPLADTILVLDRGRLVEAGSHTDLLALAASATDSHQEHGAPPRRIHTSRTAPAYGNDSPGADHVPHFPRLLRIPQGSLGITATRALPTRPHLFPSRLTPPAAVGTPLLGADGSTGSQRIAIRGAVRPQVPGV